MVEEGVSLLHLSSEGNSPVVFWSGASLASAVLEVIELAFEKLGEAASTVWSTNLS